MAGDPNARQFQLLRQAADHGPRTAPLSQLRARADAHSVAQRVRFSANEEFTTTHVAPTALPAPLEKAVAGLYQGKAEARTAVIDKPEGVQAWLADPHHLVDAPARIHAQVRATDWEQLGAKPIRALEAESMSLGFFEQQATVIAGLGRQYAEQIRTNPGRPIRIGSFQFGRAGPDQPLTTTLVPKVIEPAITEFITDASLLTQVGTEPLREQVRENLNQTLFSSGQYQWIAANWAQITAGHNVFVDVDFYPDRMASAAGLHKDSVGDTLFVNLTYANAGGGISPEYVIDNTTPDITESDMPDVAKTLVGGIRHDNREDAGNIQGLDLPERGRVSFVDPAVWHSTPLYGRRAPPIRFADGEHTLPEARDLVNASPLGQRAPGLAAIERLENQLRFPAEDCLRLFGFTSAQAFSLGELRTHAAGLMDPAKSQLLLKITEVAAGARVPAATFNEAFARETETFGSASHFVRQEGGGRVRTPENMHPEGRRRQRARSMNLGDNVEAAALLREQATQPRTFIRTWVMLIRRPV